ncbi:hypothetical protein AOQ84DRAFT_275333, partial [Glonium stellatum]
IVEDVKTYTQCLMDLSSSIDCPARDPEYHDQVPKLPALEKRNAHDYYADLIRIKFPKASVDLVKYLGEANWERYRRLEAERATNASTEMQDAVAGSIFHDSGMGSSVPPRTIYAATDTSYMSSLADGDRPRIPPLSEDAKKGHLFEKHLYLDLRPYTCFYSKCPYNRRAFLDRKTWIDHFCLDHGLTPDWHNQSCPLCFEATGNGRSPIQRHLARHMEHISLAAL